MRGKLSHAKLRAKWSPSAHPVAKCDGQRANDLLAKRPDAFEPPGLF